MSPPRVLVLRAPGTNCDAETKFAFEQAGAHAEVLHLNRWMDSPELIQRVQILCIPGGFSYGDDVAAGRIFANQLRGRLGDQLQTFRDNGGLALGICNGFQVLLKAGLLDADDQQGPAATLTWNQSGRFLDRWVHLETASDRSVFLAGIESLYLPIAHAEGNFAVRDQATFDRLAKKGQFALKYCAAPTASPSTECSDYNPNGATGDVAGMCDASGQVLGMMPHPERFIERTQHPAWTRMPPFAEGDGLQIFRNAVRYFM